MYERRGIGTGKRFISKAPSRTARVKVGAVPPYTAMEVSVTEAKTVEPKSKPSRDCKS